MTGRLATALAMAALAAAAMAQAPGQPGGDFAESPEKAVVAQACTACHVTAQVTGQKRSKEEWTNIVDKMIGFGAKVPDDKFDVIVAYLSRFYGSDVKPN